MTRNEYIKQLQHHLKGMPNTEIEEALAYYEEYFSEGGVENEEKIIEELGTPKAVAAQIKAECAWKSVDEPKKGVKDNLSMVWVIALAIFASPIALPLALAAVAVLFAMLISVIAVVFAFVVTGIALILAGIVCIVAAVIVFVQDIAISIFMLGSGLIILALGWLIFLSSVWCGQLLILLVAKLFRKMIRKERLQ